LNIVLINWRCIIAINQIAIIRLRRTSVKLSTDIDLAYRLLLFSSRKLLSVCFQFVNVRATFWRHVLSHCLVLGGSLWVCTISLLNSLDQLHLRQWRSEGRREIGVFAILRVRNINGCVCVLTMSPPKVCVRRLFWYRSWVQVAGRSIL
jgi:hypothetical protein